MTAQSTDAELPRRLIEAAARLLHEQGPSGLSTRKLAAEVGTSTMVVYTYFGGLPALVQAVAREGFQRLAQHMADVPRSGDPLMDLIGLAFAYRANALQNPHLYAVMFQSPATAEQGRYTFDGLVAAVQRAMDEGAFRAGDAEAVAAAFWSALHGFVTLEIAGLFAEYDDVEARVLTPLLMSLGTAHLA